MYPLTRYMVFTVLERPTTQHLVGGMLIIVDPGHTEVIDLLLWAAHGAGRSALRLAICSGLLRPWVVSCNLLMVRPVCFYTDRDAMVLQVLHTWRWGGGGFRHLPLVPYRLEYPTLPTCNHTAQYLCLVRSFHCSAYINLDITYDPSIMLIDLMNSNPWCFFVNTPTIPLNWRSLLYSDGFTRSYTEWMHLPVNILTLIYSIRPLI